MDRRALLTGSLTGFAVYALLTEARAAVAPGTKLSSQRWIARQDELARGLAGGTVSQIAWHDGVNGLAREVDVAALAAEIKRARLRPAGDPFGHDPVKHYVTFVDDNGAPVRVAYGAAIFSFAKDSVITPHVHKHMASAHMVIDGKVRVRTFDRLADDGNAAVLMPTSDVVAEAGHAAAMTSAKDNGHWFAAASDSAMTFDVIIDGLDAGTDRYTIQPVDVIGGTRRGDGAIVAPFLSFDESMQRYTAAL